MVLVNGKPESSISTSDRGLNYGDGLFETMVVIDGRVRFFQDHLARLKNGCKKLAIPMPALEAIEGDLDKLMPTDQNTNFIFKVLVTRGESGRGYMPDNEASTTRVCSRYDMPANLSALWDAGLAVHVCATRLANNPQLAGIKHTNRLEQVIASRERLNTKYQEGVMLSIDEYVVEGTKSNIFWQTDDEFFTPSLNQNGVAGVSRAKVIEILKKDHHTVNVGKYRLADVQSSDLVFMTNSTMLIAQVAQLEQTVWPINPLLKELRQALASDT